MRIIENIKERKCLINNTNCRGNKVYSSTHRVSSNFARDKKMNKDMDSFSLGEEPIVDHRKTFKMNKIHVESLLRNKQSKKNDILSKPRKCPDESLYEDLVDSIRVHSENHDNPYMERCSDDTSEDLTKSKPFRRLESCLFSCFTSCAPWWLMRRIYWNGK